MKNGKGNKISVLLISFIFFMDSCIKETIPCDETLSLPPISESGLGEMGFIKNGEVWVVSGRWLLGELGSSVEHEVGLYYNEGNLSLSGGMDRRCDEDNPISDNFRLELTNIHNAGTYTLDSLGVNYESDNYCLFHELSGQWIASNGTFTVSKLDTVERIISGTFDLDLFWHEDNTQTLHITEGRFDAEY